MRQLLQHVLMGELLVTTASLVALIQDDAAEPLIGSFLPQFFDFVTFDFLSLGHFLRIASVFDACTGPLVPATLDLRNRNLCTKLLFNLCVFLSLELLHDGIAIFGNKQFLEVIFFNQSFPFGVKCIQVIHVNVVGLLLILLFRIFIKLDIFFLWLFLLLLLIIRLVSNQSK